LGFFRPDGHPGQLLDVAVWTRAGSLWRGGGRVSPTIGFLPTFLDRIAQMSASAVVGSRAPAEKCAASFTVGEKAQKTLASFCVPANPRRCRRDWLSHRGAHPDSALGWTSALPKSLWSCFGKENLHILWFSEPGSNLQSAGAQIAVMKAILDFASFVAVLSRCKGSCLQ